MRLSLAIAVSISLLACADTTLRSPANEANRATEAPPPAADTYIKHIAFEMRGHEFVTLRWQKRQMPLRVHLPAPPDGLFRNGEAIHDSVRDGVLDWTDAAGEGIPRFVFVDDPRDADIPVVWAAEPDGDWYIAHCAYGMRAGERRFAVARILVTANWGDGRTADLHTIHATMLHEMGHALGLGGHSPDAGDIMYPRVRVDSIAALSTRDRATIALLYARPIGARVIGARRE